MAHPSATLLPWLVFAVAAALKGWRLVSLLRRHLWGGSSATERFRQSLERIWLQEQESSQPRP